MDTAGCMPVDLEPVRSTDGAHPLPMAEVYVRRGVSQTLSRLLRRIFLWQGEEHGKCYDEAG